MHDLYDGRVSYENVDKFDQELATIHRELKAFSPDQVVADMKEPSKKLPWGDDISKDITDLSNYFVTCDGKQLFDNFAKAIDCSRRLYMPIHLASSFDDIRTLD